MTRDEKALFKILPITYNKLAICLLFSFISIFLLVGCQSSTNARTSVISYVDAKSSSNLIQEIESHYWNWHKVPYRYGGNSYKGVDCSAFTMNFFNSYVNKSIPRVTAAQARIGKTVSTLKAGDLVFFKTGNGETGLHVGIYYKNGLFLHASTSQGVIFSDLTSGYWKKHYWKAQRIES